MVDLTNKPIMPSRGFWLTAITVLVAILVPATYFLTCALYPVHYQETVEAVAQEYDLPPSLLYAVIHTESGFRPDAQSSANAKGLMQITDETYNWARQMGKTGEKKDVSVLYDPEKNIRYGGLILHLLQKEFSNTEAVLAAYNAGQGHVRTWLKDPAYSEDGCTLYDIPFRETKTYVRRVLRTQKRYQKFYHID